MPLSWKNRPQEIQEKINDAFNQLSSATRAWGMCNGLSEYNLANVKEYCLISHYISSHYISSHSAQKIFNILDIGAGNGALGQSLAELLEHDNTIPRDIKVNFHSTRAEILDVEPTQGEIAGTIEHNAFKAENLEEEIKSKCGEGTKFDMIFTHFCLRHLIDPVSTFAQALDLLKQDGYMLGDGFIYTVQGEPNPLQTPPYGTQKGSLEHNMVSLLLDTKCPFLFYPCYEASRIGQFILTKNKDAPVDLRLKYTDVYSIDQSSKLAQCNMTFESTKEGNLELVREEQPQSSSSYVGLRGDKDLYNHLLNAGCFDSQDTPFYAGHYQEMPIQLSGEEPTHLEL